MPGRSMAVILIIPQKNKYNELTSILLLELSVWMYRAIKPPIIKKYNWDGIKYFEVVKFNFDVVLNKKMMLEEINPRNKDQRAIGYSFNNINIKWLSITILNKIPKPKKERKFKL